MNTVKKVNTSVIDNRKATYDYSIESTLECGISLSGNEVKSLRAGMASIKEAWVSIDGPVMTIKQMHISKWGTSNQFDVDTDRERSLLAHRGEIRKLREAIKKEGYTLVPMRVYFTDRGKCKVLVGLGKGKKSYDKRECAKVATANRDMQRALKDRD